MEISGLLYCILPVLYCQSNQNRHCNVTLFNIVPKTYLFFYTNTKMPSRTRKKDPKKGDFFNAQNKSWVKMRTVEVSECRFDLTWCNHCVLFMVQLDGKIWKWKSHFPSIYELGFIQLHRSQHCGPLFGMHLQMGRSHIDERQRSRKNIIHKIVCVSVCLCVYVCHTVVMLDWLFQDTVMLWWEHWHSMMTNWKRGWDSCRMVRTFVFNLLSGVHCQMKWQRGSHPSIHQLLFERSGIPALILSWPRLSAVLCLAVFQGYWTV